MAEALIALGSNLGDRLANLNGAAKLLGRSFCILRASRVYETAPMYVSDQPPFLNAALAVEADCSPMSLLAAAKGIEREVGRMPRQRYGPREIDIDLIAYGALEYCYMRDGIVVLALPHPKTPERRFVLQPLNEVAQLGALPGLGSIAELLSATQDQSDSVRALDDAVLSI